MNSVMNKVSGILLVGFSICVLAISNIMKADTETIRLTEYFLEEQLAPNLHSTPMLMLPFVSMS